MAVKEKEFYDQKQEIKKSKSKRCLLCGIDHEILMAQILKVNELTWNKLNEVHNKDTYLVLVNTSFNNPHIGGATDDLTLKQISGTCYEVNLELCLECIDRIGHKHKFKKKYLNIPFANRYI